MRFFYLLKRYITNLARLNNLKFRVDFLEEQNSLLKALLQKQDEIIKTELQKQDEIIKTELQKQDEIIKTELQKQDEIIKTEINAVKNSIESAVAKQIFYQSLSLQQRVDQFVFDSNIELKTKIAKDI